jgi:hypothetical protein
MASENSPNAKDVMAATPHKITLKDKSGVTQTWMVSDKILRDMNATKKYAEATGAKPDYSRVLRLGVRMGEVILASRPGAKDVMAVEDRFYFGKGRKERFAERSAMGESDLRELLRQSYLALGDESDRAKINTNFLNAVMSRPAYFSPDGIAGGRSTHELVQIIRKRLTYK